MTGTRLSCIGRTHSATQPVVPSVLVVRAGVERVSRLRLRQSSPDGAAPRAATCAGVALEPAGSVFVNKRAHSALTEIIDYLLEPYPPALQHEFDYIT